MRSALRRARLSLVTLTGTAAGASAVLAVLVIVATFVAVAMPRASLSFRTAALRNVLRATPAIGRTVVATSDYSVISQALGLTPNTEGNVVDAGLFSGIADEIGSRFIAAGVPLQPAAARWWGVSTNFLPLLNPPRLAMNGSYGPQLEVLYRPVLTHFGVVVAGRMPTTSAVTPRGARFEAAVSTGTAAKWGLHVGSRFKLVSGGVPITLTVSGIMRPVDAASSFWTADPDAAAPSFNKTTTRQGSYWVGAVFVAPQALIDLEKAYTGGSMQLTWEFPLALGSVNANQAASLSSGLNRALQTAGVVNAPGFSGPTGLSVTSGVADRLAQFVQTEGRVGSVLTLLYVSLTVVSAAVLLLGGLLLAERRASELGVMRARGAARWQLALLGLRTSALAVLPAAAAGAAAGAWLTPGGDEPLAWWLAAATALTALLGVPALAVRRALVPSQARERADVRPGRAARAKRLVFDVTLASAAVGGIVVLRSQGNSPAGSIDWYTSAAPALVAAPVAIVLARLYPVMVRWLLWAVGRRTEVGAYVGLARAARGSLSAALPVFALVLALGVIAFGATVRAAVLRSDQAESWWEIGADVVVNAANSSAPLTAATQHAIAGLPGVARSARVTVLAGTAADGSTLPVVSLEPASYRAVLAETPARSLDVQLTSPISARPGVTTAPWPAVASPAAVAAMGPSPSVLVGGFINVRLRVVGTASRIPGVAANGPFVLLPDWAIARAVGPDLAKPNLLLAVGSGTSTASMRSVVARLLPGASVTFRSTVLAALTSAPLPHSAQVSFEQGAAAAAGLGAVILAIMLALGARPRELTLARLLTMGLSPGQARRLVIAESMPAIAAAVLGGLCCAWALVFLLGSAVDLSPLTGTAAPVPVRADYAALGYIAAGLLILSMLTLFGQMAATRFRGIARALRVGD